MQPSKSAKKIDGKADIVKSAREMQDDIFRKMSGERKFKLACDFSEFLLKTNQRNGISRINS